VHLETAAQRVNVDFPVDLLRAIDREARRIGVTRSKGRVLDRPVRLA
jgi:metal-responsive CopG/Arc/MetJ family transcriptional regulator